MKSIALVELKSFLYAENIDPFFVIIVANVVNGSASPNVYAIPGYDGSSKPKQNNIRHFVMEKDISTLVL